jgi:Pentapeptide repeats (8 copies)
LIALLGLGLVLLLLWALVTVPALLLGVDQVQETRQVQDPAKRLDEVNGLRTTLAGVLGGLAVAVGAIVAALNFRETQRQNRATQEQNRAVLELQRRGQVTERFTRAIDQLGQRGDDRLDVRIGAVYALEQIARDSAELHWPIMEVLTAYLRQHAPARADAEPHADAEDSADAARRRLPADHQAIATVVGRRQREQDPDGQRLDLHETDLCGVLWQLAHLEGAWLRGAQLEGANLIGAHLEGADLGDGAHLEGTRLDGAHLEGAWLAGANLNAAYLVGAHLEGAFLEGAHLEGAHLDGANLEGAWLAGANLKAANLDYAHLEGAKGLGWHQLEWVLGLEGASLSADLAASLPSGKLAALLAGASAVGPPDPSPGGAPDSRS